MEYLQSTEIITAIIGFIASIITAIISYKAALRSARLKMEKEKHPLQKANFMITLKSFTEISEHVIEAFSRTKADRFLILTAHNGKDHLRFASVIYEQYDDSKNNARLSFGAVSKYVNFEFDEHYRKMLKEVEVNGLVELDVSKMPESDLKNVYKNEQVRHSKVYFINRIKNYDSRDNDLLIYSTFATHNDNEFTAGEKITLRTAISNIKIILSDIITKQ
jgi:hypothetical protein